MNLKELDKFLKTYTSEELFYKEYSKSNTNNKKPSLDIINNNLTLSKSIIPLITENATIDNNSDIKIQKYCRYKPKSTYIYKFFQLIYVYSGTCHLEVDNKSLNFTKGDILILAPNVPYIFDTYNDSIILNIFICKNDVNFNELFQQLLTENNILSQFFVRALYTNNYENYIIFHTDNDKNLRTIVLKMLVEQLNNKKYSENIINTMLLLFFHYLIQDHRNNSETSSIIANNDQILNDILVYIQKNYTWITLNHLCNKFHFSKAYLSKHLKEYTGTNFSHIIRYIKLKKSCDLLKYTNMNLSQISSTVGYPNQEHFIRVFEKEFNISPTQYRKTV